MVMVMALVELLPKALQVFTKANLLSHMHLSYLWYGRFLSIHFKALLELRQTQIHLLLPLLPCLNRPQAHLKIKDWEAF